MRLYVAEIRVAIAAQDYPSFLNKIKRVIREGRDVVVVPVRGQKVRLVCSPHMAPGAARAKVAEWKRFEWDEQLNLVEEKKNRKSKVGQDS